MEWVETCTFGDLLVRAADRWPDHPAIVFPERRHTYGSLLGGATRAARSLLGLGVGRGDHVGILMPNCMDFVETLFGSQLIGARVIPINSRFKGQELTYVVENADLKVLLTSDIVDQFTDYVEILSTCLTGLPDAPDPYALDLECAPQLRSVVLLGDKSPAGMVDRAGFEAAAARATDADVEHLRERIALRDIAIMMYTSGTTAVPKGCPMTHEALVRTAVAAGRTRFEFTHEDVLWDPLPLFHMSSILPMIGVFDAGSTYVTLTHIDPSVALRQIREERCTVNFATFPAVTLMLLNHPEFDPSIFAPMRLMNNVALPEALQEIAEKLPGSKHISAYGCTEIGGVICFNEPDDPLEKRFTTCGRPFRGIDVEIRDIETGEPLATGERGEIWVKGYNLFEGYYKDDEKNAECFDPDGWFCTGDLGAVDDHGRVAYLGRTKDMLKVGGENVAAAEIEALVQQHPAVLLAQVVGAPDPKYVEVPAAFVQLRPGHTATEDEIIEFCQGKIARFKIPRLVRFVQEWPMSATKIQKFRLRDQL